MRLAILALPLFLLLGAGSWAQTSSPIDVSPNAMASPRAAPRGGTMVPLRPPGMTMGEPPMGGWAFPLSTMVRTSPGM
jgi:hypothetical protein